eukprot:TRINITY_DN18302_c0_g1_i2.p1 TRINITY_DN18302_c0_g1~~TRINITY_DN18302_c0_g1_i2.p1  ORF type:complete len:515 (+),score=76.40 TRINITY_DN18302_c0_g1_i2:33-1577(+)
MTVNAPGDALGNPASQSIKSSPLLTSAAEQGHGTARDVELVVASLESGERDQNTGTQESATSPRSDDVQNLCKRNIHAMFAFQFVAAVAWGMSMGPVFDRYLYLLGSGWARGPRLIPIHGANSLVGVSESISGITSLVMAIPVGLVVDRHPERRARLLRWSSWLGLAATVLTILAVLSDELILVAAMLVLFGAFSELSFSASEAIFADSIPAGQRTGLFVTKTILSTVGSATGPGLSALGLWMLGDDWKPYQMKAVIITGSLLFPLAAVPLFLFKDPPLDLTCSSSGDSGQAEDGEARDGEAHSRPSTADVQNVRRIGPLTAKHIPVLLATADFITCIGAGMTVKFFNLFFIQDQSFSPVAISVLQMFYPLMIAVFMKFTERLAKPLGRPQASLLFFSCNVLCLFLLGEVTWLPLLLAVFLLRGGFANSTYPIDRSILMDYTPSSQRGMWNSIESLTSMTWSGSAFIGGLLSDGHDYRFTFLITALVYATACLVYAPLLVLVPRRENIDTNSEA